MSAADNFVSAADFDLADIDLVDTGGLRIRPRLDKCQPWELPEYDHFITSGPLLESKLTKVCDPRHGLCFPVIALELLCLDRKSCQN